MSKQTFILSTSLSRANAVQAVRTAQDGVKVTISDPSRTLAQNDLIHSFYEELALSKPENDALGWKCFCKLNYGVPILRAEDEEFRDFYDNALKKTLTYEQKIEAMKFVPVTSLMSKVQLTRYYETMKEKLA